MRCVFMECALCILQTVMRGVTRLILDAGANFLGQNIKSHFSPVSRIVESRTVVYVQVAKKVVSVLKSTVEQLNKRCVHKRSAYFGRLFLLITNIYPAHMPFAAALHDVA